MRPTRLLVLAFISLVVAGPIGGFIFGFMNANDPHPSFLGRVFIGCVMAVLTPLSGGFPPENEGGVGPSSNAWPHIIFASFVIFSVLVLWTRIKTQKE